MKLMVHCVVLVLSAFILVQTLARTHHYRVSRIICPLTTYYDENLDKCVQSKGNGQLLKVNHGMKCKSNYVGILPHYKSSKYYYVCKKNSVLMFKCSKKEYFNKISSMCEKRKKKVGNYIFSSPRLRCHLKKSFVPIIRDNNYWGTFFRSYYTTDSTTASSETTENIASILPTQQTMIPFRSLWNTMNTYFERESDDKHSSSEIDDRHPTSEIDDRHSIFGMDPIFGIDERSQTSVIDNNVMSSITTTEEPPVDRVFESFVIRNPKEEEIPEIDDSPRTTEIADIPRTTERANIPRTTVTNDNVVDSITTTEEPPITTTEEPPIDRVFESFVVRTPDDEMQSVATTTTSNDEGNSTDYLETSDNVDTRELIEYYDIVQYYDTDFNDTIIYETELKNTTIQERKSTTSSKKRGYSTTTTPPPPITLSSSTTITPSNIRNENEQTRVEFENLTVEQLTKDLVEPKALYDSTTVNEESTTSSAILDSTSNIDLGATTDSETKTTIGLNTESTVTETTMVTDTSTTDLTTSMYTSTTSTDQSNESTYASTEFDSLLTSVDKETAFDSEPRALDLFETTISESTTTSETSEHSTTSDITVLGTTTTKDTETTTEFSNPSTQTTISDDVNFDSLDTLNAEQFVVFDLIRNLYTETTTTLYTTESTTDYTDVSTTTELETTTNIETTTDSPATSTVHNTEPSILSTEFNSPITNIYTDTNFDMTPRSDFNDKTFDSTEVTTTELMRSDTTEATGVTSTTEPSTESTVTEAAITTTEPTTEFTTQLTSEPNTESTTEFDNPTTSENKMAIYTTNLTTTDLGTTTDVSTTTYTVTTNDLETTTEEHTESTVTQITTTKGSNFIPSTEYKEDPTINVKHFNDYSDEISKIDSFRIETLNIMTTTDLTEEPINHSTISDFIEQTSTTEASNEFTSTIDSFRIETLSIMTTTDLTEEPINHSTISDFKTDLIEQTSTIEASNELTSTIEPIKAIETLDDSDINTLVNEVRNLPETFNLSENSDYDVSSDYEYFYSSNADAIDRQKLIKKERDDSHEYYVDSISGSVEETLDS